jgi:RNA polymerase sigma-70 factor, ECF subfamily
MNTRQTTTPHTQTTTGNTTTAGRERLFHEVILPLEPTLYGSALALTHSSSDAEDLVQDTLIRAYSRFETYRPDGSPKAWLHTIMRNLFFNRYRKNSRQPQMVSLEQYAVGSQGEALSAENEVSLLQENTQISPERQVLSQLEGDAALSAIQELPSEYREVVILSDIEGLAYQEIAEQLHIPVGTVRSRLSRGRERLRRALYSWRPQLQDPSSLSAMA